MPHLIRLSCDSWRCKSNSSRRVTAHHPIINRLLIIIVSASHANSRANMVQHQMLALRSLKSTAVRRIKMARICLASVRRIKLRHPFALDRRHPNRNMRMNHRSARRNDRQQRRRKPNLRRHKLHASHSNQRMKTRAVATRIRAMDPTLAVTTMMMSHKLLINIITTIIIDRPLLLSQSSICSTFLPQPLHPLLLLLHPSLHRSRPHHRHRVMIL